MNTFANVQRGTGDITKKWRIESINHEFMDNQPPTDTDTVRYKKDRNTFSDSFRPSKTLFKKEVYK